MRTLIISDIHGNLEALQSVLGSTDGIDSVVCLGDIVGYGPSPNECVETVKNLEPAACLAGNHDLGATATIDISLFSSAAARALVWTRSVLKPENLAYLETLKPTGMWEGAALAHGSPRDPVWEYLESPQQAAASLELIQSDACFVGHTHVPRVFEQGEEPETPRVRAFAPAHEDAVPLSDGTRRILNPGSVGQPRDGDPRAAYAVVDDSEGVSTFLRVSYAFDVTQRKIIEAGLPSSLASRLSVGM
ncbi:MAG TPA: metallophosphoesterase family protein [Chloroflexota bacterium]